MYREIELDTQEGKKTFKFLASGSTAIRYKQIFHQDLMVVLNKLQELETSDNVDTSVVDKLAYIMNCQAEKADMTALNEEGFIAWADQFDGTTLLSNMDKIVGLYLGNKFTTSKPKKAVARQSGK